MMANTPGEVMNIFATGTHIYLQFTSCFLIDCSFAREIREILFFLLDFLHDFFLFLTFTFYSSYIIIFYFFTFLCSNLLFYTVNHYSLFVLLLAYSPTLRPSSLYIHPWLFLAVIHLLFITIVFLFVFPQLSTIFTIFLYLSLTSSFSFSYLSFYLSPYH